MQRRPRRSLSGFYPRQSSRPLKSPANNTDSEQLLSSDLKTPARQRIQSHVKHPQTSQLAPHRDYSVHEIVDAPAPIPDTGLSPPSTSTTMSNSPSPPVSVPASSVASKASSSRSHATLASAFVPLPYLQTKNLTEIEKVVSPEPSILLPTQTLQPTFVATTAVSSAHDRDPQLPINNSHLPTLAIVALAVGGGFTFLVVMILVKVIKRPRRRRTPTPSLPILHDGTFSGDKAENEGSPIFGGKECSSPTLQRHNGKDNSGLWTWTQYNSGISKPPPTVTVTRSSSQDQLTVSRQNTQNTGVDMVDNDTTHAAQRQRQYPFIGYSSSSAVPKTALPLQPVQNAITRAVSRLSTVSMSLYPNSPGEVGLAIDGVMHSEQDNKAVPKYKDKMGGSRIRTSMIAAGSARDATGPGTTGLLRRSQSFAYGGMEPTSPPASANRAQLNGGRARIKSTYYTPGSYPRTSGAATNYGREQEQEAFRLGQQNRVQRTDSRRGRDLTSALGLATAMPASPQPTLYPDDSMSVIGEAKKDMQTGRSQKKPIPNDRPPSDTAALGNLMLVESTGGCGAETVAGKSNQKKRVEDKPPRVPSPPLMPSLAQMALQHADPEGYADYHSPTYSIYGLYDGERKSRVMSYGM